MQKIKILLVLLACGSMVVLLDSCNGGTGTSAVIPEPTIEPSPQPAPSPSPRPDKFIGKLCQSAYLSAIKISTITR